MFTVTQCELTLTVDVNRPWNLIEDILETVRLQGAKNKIWTALQIDIRWKFLPLWAPPVWVTASLIESLFNVTTAQPIDERYRR